MVEVLAERFDLRATITSAARTAWGIGWANAEELAGRSIGAVEILEVMPQDIPAPFLTWATDAVDAAFMAAAKDDHAPDGGWIASGANAEMLGHAIALTMTGSTAGFEEYGLDPPEGLPFMDLDPRLQHWPEEASG